MTGPIADLHPVFDYAARGWPVVPLHRMLNGACTCGQANEALHHTPGKHPRTRNGLKDGSTDPKQIHAWLAQWPESNWAICTGKTLVIDVDIHKGGGETWAKLTEGKPREQLDTVRQKTGSGGGHFLYLNPPEHMFRNTSGHLGPGIDTRGVDGYIVAPPSNHVSGGVYEWIKGYAPHEHDVLPLPDFLVQLLKGKKNGHAGLVPLDIGERIPRGRRDSTLLSLAGSLRARGLPQTVIEQQLLDCNKKLCDPPHDEKSVLAIARRYKMDKKDLPIQVLTSERLDDIGNGARLAAVFGHEFRYVHEWEWMVWEDGRWCRDTRGRMHEYAKQLVRMLQEIALRTENDEQRKALLSHVNKSGNMPKLNQMIAAARSEPGIHTNVEDFDSHDFKLNCKNGTVDLLTGHVAPHNPNDLLTSLVDIVYDPDAKCPRWESFIEEFAAGLPGLLDYLQRAIGYSLTGSTSEQKVFFLWGDGSNGKSVLLAIIGQLLGSMSGVLNFSTLLAGRDNNTENTLAGLVGKRLITAIEAGGGRAFNEEILKTISGEDKVHARYMYNDGFDYLPKFKPWLAANDKPVIRGSDHGIWRRLHVIPCQNHVPEHKQDKELKRKLEAELPGILAWAVRGAMAWHAKGLQAPPCVLQAVEEYRTENDVFGEFLAECCTIDPSLSCSAQDLQAEQARWAEGRREKPMTPQALGRRLSRFNAGVLKPDKYDGGKRIWKGIGIGRARPAAQAQLGSVGPEAPQDERLRHLLELVRAKSRENEKGIVTESHMEQILVLEGWSVDDVRHGLRTLLRNNAVYCKLGAGTYAPLNLGPAVNPA